MTYCFCQTSENSELMVQGSSTHARRLATVLTLIIQFFSIGGFCILAIHSQLGFQGSVPWRSHPKLCIGLGTSHTCVCPA